MCRGANEQNRSKQPAGSMGGNDTDPFDAEPSESGSLMGHSSAVWGTGKKRTIEERDADYNEAWSRIFMDFEKEEEEKEKHTNASPSKQSLISGLPFLGRKDRSNSIDGCLNTSTEIECSEQFTRLGKDLQQIGSSNTVNGWSSRSLRPSAPPFNATAPNSSQELRTPSPVFKYATLYDPPPVAAAPYDPAPAASTASNSSQELRTPSPVFKYATLYDPPPVAAAPYDPAPAASRTPTFSPQVSHNYQLPHAPQNHQTYLATYPNFAPYPYPSPNNMFTSECVSPFGPGAYIPSHQQIPYVPYPNLYLLSNAHQPPVAVSIPMQHPNQPLHHPHSGGIERVGLRLNSTIRRAPQACSVWSGNTATSSTGSGGSSSVCHLCCCTIS